MTAWDRTTLPELTICCNCGVLFRLVRIELPFLDEGVLLCACGNEIACWEGEHSYTIEPAEAALHFEAN